LLFYHYVSTEVIVFSLLSEMKILHTADWHLGKKLDLFSRLEEQKEVMEEICQIADKEEVNVVIVAGDLYDQFNPATEAVELFYKTLKHLSNNGNRVVVAIAGNHDSPERIEAPDPLAKECGIVLLGFPDSVVKLFDLKTGIKVIQSEPGFIEVEHPECKDKLRLLLTPYANELRLRKFLGTENQEEELRILLKEKWSHLADKYCDEKGINLLVAHLFFAEKGKASLVEPDGEKTILVGGASAIYTADIPDQIQYTALGHLHKYQELKGAKNPVLYSSSPLAYSFAEAGQEKYVVLLDAKAGKEIKYNKIALKKGLPLARKEFQEIEEAVEWLEANPNCLVELTIVTDEYLPGSDRKRIYAVHDKIVKLNLKLKSEMKRNENDDLEIDLTKSVDELFEDYFKYKNENQAPPEEVIKLFKELQSL